MRPQTRRRARRWAANLFLAAGLVGVGWWAWAQIRQAVYQDWDSWAFERGAQGQSASVGQYLEAKKDELWNWFAAWWGHHGLPKLPHPRITPHAIVPGPRPRVVIKDGTVIGRLEVPRLHLSAMVREGTSARILSVALGHIPGTAFPGQNGNSGVAGHRDTLFRGLGAIRRNDIIQFRTMDGDYSYQVESTQIVRPQDVGVLRPGEHPEMTLVTCYPFYYIGSAPERFVVKARLMEHTEQTAAKPAEVAVAPPKKAHVREPGTLAFHLMENQSRSVAPGISMGLSWADASRQRVSGWLWVMPDRRTIWLRDQKANVPIVFYNDGAKRELVVTNVGAHSAAGYLQMSANNSDTPSE